MSLWTGKNLWTDLSPVLSKVNRDFPLNQHLNVDWDIKGLFCLSCYTEIFHLFRMFLSLDLTKCGLLQRGHLLSQAGTDFAGSQRLQAKRICK